MVLALAIALGGFQFEAHLLANGPAQEPAHAVGLPAGQFHQFIERGSIFAAQKLDHLGVLLLFGSAALLALLVSLVAGLAAVFSFATAASPRSRPALVIFGAFVYFAFDISISFGITVMGIIRYDSLGFGPLGSFINSRTRAGRKAAIEPMGGSQLPATRY